MAGACARFPLLLRLGAQASRCVRLSAVFRLCPSVARGGDVKAKPTRYEEGSEGVSEKKTKRKGCGCESDHEAKGERKVKKSQMPLGRPRRPAHDSVQPTTAPPNAVCAATHPTGYAHENRLRLTARNLTIPRLPPSSTSQTRSPPPAPAPAPGPAPTPSTRTAPPLSPPPFPPTVPPRPAAPSAPGPVARPA